MKVGLFKTILTREQMEVCYCLLVVGKKQNKETYLFVWQQMYSTKGCLTKFHLV